MSALMRSATHFIRYDDGSVSKIETDTDAEPTAPAGGVFITEDEYNTEIAALQQAAEDHVAQLKQEEQQSAREDYEALVAAGIPDAVALRLSGYVPPVEGGVE